MRKFCPKACKFCGKKIVDGCYNNWQDSLCQHLADRGTCRDPMWKERLARHCARSCEICTINTPPLEQVRPLCAKEGCCWDNKTPISKGCPREYIAVFSGLPSQVEAHRDEAYKLLLESLVFKIPRKNR